MIVRFIIFLWLSFSAQSTRLVLPFTTPTSVRTFYRPDRRRLLVFEPILQWQRTAIHKLMRHDICPRTRQFSQVDLQRAMMILQHSIALGPRLSLEMATQGVHCHHQRSLVNILPLVYPDTTKSLHFVIPIEPEKESFTQPPYIQMV